MVRVTKVNYYRLYIAGKRFDDNGKKLEDIINNIKELDEQLKNSWQGLDADMFINRNEIFINMLTKKMKYLNSWGEYFVKSSSKYTDTENENLGFVRKINVGLLEEKKNVKY